MKAMVLREFGGPENFVEAELPMPAAGRGQVLVRIAAASVNPIDYKIRGGGRMMPEAGILGCDMAGVVTAVGDGVTGFAPGDRVYGCVGGVQGLQGTYAGYVAADARLLAKAPAGLDLRQAAALPLVTLTAWEGLVDRARMQAGDTVLVRGGTGGVGHVAVQIAKARGARVVATISSDAKAAIARDLGADEIVNHRTETLEAAAARLTGGRGFDIVFDATGGNDLESAFQAARLNGQVVTIVSTFPADLSAMHQRGLSLHVVFMPIPMLHDPKDIPIDRAHQGRVLAQAAELAAAGRLRPLLDERRFALAEVAAAHRRLEGGQAVGKIVLDVDPSLI